MSGYLGFQNNELQLDVLVEEVTELRNEVETLKVQVEELLNDRDSNKEEN